MAVQSIHSFLVHPKPLDGSTIAIGGTSISHSGRLFEMLKNVYEKSDEECTIDISFNHSADGKQQNDCRDLLTAYLSAPAVESGRLIAERLHAFTTKRSGLGLLFTIAGKEGNDHKLVVSRFPADSGILAEEDESSLSVEFLEKVFMKSATSYKAAVYRGASTKAQFWDGMAVDKQINSGVLTISNYWIKDFLASDFKTTSAAGTRRLAVAIRTAVRKADDLAVKEELTAASRLAPNHHGKTLSMRGFANKLQLSDAAQTLLKDQLPSPSLFTERFTFSREEFSKHVAFQSLELDNGGILMADAQRFDDVFTEESVDGGKRRFVTQGRVVDRKLKSSRS